MYRSVLPDSQAPDEEPEDLARYGYRKFLNDQPLSDLIKRTIDQACVDYLHSKSDKPSDVPLLYLIQKAISALSGTSFSFSSIEPTGSSARFRNEVITEAQPEPVLLQQVSQGTVSVLVILGLIYEYLRIVARANPISSPLMAPGFVIIDEIDAHLHPVWQTSIVDVLRECFPHVQFICAAHSPLVVAGSLENEVSVLRRSADAKFTMQNIASDFVGWRAEKILRRVFDVEDQDPTFNRYSAMAPRRSQIKDEVRGLTRKPRLSAEETVRLQRLRQDLYYIDKAQAMQQTHSREEYLLARAQQLHAHLDSPTPRGDSVIQS